MHSFTTSAILIILALSISAKKTDASKENSCEAKAPLSQIVYPWPHSYWPEVHVYWNYDMWITMISTSEKGKYVNLARLRTDSKG